MPKNQEHITEGSVDKAQKRIKISEKGFILTVKISLVLILSGSILAIFLLQPRVGPAMHEIIPVYSYDDECYYFILNGEKLPVKIKSTGKSANYIPVSDELLYFSSSYQKDSGADKKTYQKHFISPTGKKQANISKSFFEFYRDSKGRLWTSGNTICLLSDDLKSIEKEFSFKVYSEEFFGDTVVYSDSSDRNAKSTKIYTFDLITYETKTISSNSVRLADIHPPFEKFDEDRIWYRDADVNATVIYNVRTGAKTTFEGEVCYKISSSNKKYTVLYTQGKNPILYLYDGENATYLCEGIYPLNVANDGSRILGRSQQGKELVIVDKSGNISVISESGSGMPNADISEVLVFSEYDIFLYKIDGTFKKLYTRTDTDKKYLSLHITEVGPSLAGRMFTIDGYYDSLYYIDKDYNIKLLTEKGVIYNTAKTIDHDCYVDWYADDYCFYYDYTDNSIYRYSTENGGKTELYAKCAYRESGYTSIRICEDEKSIYIRDVDEKLYFADGKTLTLIDENVTDFEFEYDTCIYKKVGTADSSYDYYHSYRGSNGALLLEDSVATVRIYDGCIYLYKDTGKRLEDYTAIYDVYGGASPAKFKCLIKNAGLH